MENSMELDPYDFFPEDIKDFISADLQKQNLSNTFEIVNN